MSSWVLCPAIVEHGFRTEVQRKVLETLINKSMRGDVDVSIKFFKLLSKHLFESMGMNNGRLNHVSFEN